MTIRHRAREISLLILSSLLIVVIYIPACNSNGTLNPSPTPEATATPDKPKVEELKWHLWTDDVKLRGANIHQRHVYPELDGLEFIGPGPLGAPFTQEDFNLLSDLGANYVNISHPGLYTENPPYIIDQDVQNNLDSLLVMIEKADMFAVISFRTGPGRSEFTFQRENVGDWFDESYFNEEVWLDWHIQEAWVDMWRYTAERYRNNPVVVGYDLMVEPNSNDSILNIYDPDEFYEYNKNSLYDWNQLSRRIANSIREVDSWTPILVSGLGYGAVEWLPFVEPLEHDRVVYTVHQYAPMTYTHQQKDSLDLEYPGIWDINGDGTNDKFNKAWLEGQISIIDSFKETYAVPVAINEFGIMRWEPGAVYFLNDEMYLFEQHALNYALWAWEPSWNPYTEKVDAFNYRHGTNPDNNINVFPNDLMTVITGYWERNEIRPSNIQDLRTSASES